MTWWNPFARKSAVATGDDIRDALAALIDSGASAKAGVAVTVETALQVTAVLACVRALANGIAQVPLKLYEGQEETRAKRIAREHPLHYLLHRRPNDWQTSFEFRETMMFHALLTGDAVAFKNTTNGGRIVELLPIDPRWLKVEQRPDLTLTYEVRYPDGRRQQLPRSAFLHLKGPSWNAYSGLKGVKVLRDAVGLSIAAEETHARLHANGARPGGILSVEGGPLSEESKAQLKEAWSRAFNGPNAFKTAVLDVGVKWQSMAMTGVDAQHLETRRFQNEEVARGFGVFPQMIMQSDKTSTYASAEQFFLAHVVYSLGPWYERWEQVLERDLLSQADLRRGLFWKFSAEGLLRGDARTRSEFYSKAIHDGWMTRNEVREREDLNPLPGLDEPLLPLNMGPGGSPPGVDSSDSN